MDKILIKSLRCEAIIGVEPRERQTKQPLIINLELFTDIKRPAQSGDIADAVDYAKVASRVKEFVEGSEFLLLESLIQRIADIVLMEFNIIRADCTVYKPEAIQEADTVGIAISRSR